ncbi:MAG: hypothetical protein D6678_07490 [Zetaproteobacteria bacterium]|nr:MAG: hypothetical protein D6678_07490 [Zetaproteobacteria bacterium]
MSKVSTLPGAFPLGEDREFLSESEWVILKLLCRPVATLAEADASELSAATGGQITPERCDELIRIVRIQRLAGLGSWAARLLAEAGFDDEQLLSCEMGEVVARVNASLGYPVFNAATERALVDLQRQWRMAKGMEQP